MIPYLELLLLAMPCQVLIITVFVGFGTQLLH